MKNLQELNNQLFDQLSRLSKPDLKGDALVEEIRRSNAVTSISTQIIKNGQLVLGAQKLIAEHLRPGAKLPAMLTDNVHTINGDE
jgi:hypothetical protein